MYTDSIHIMQEALWRISNKQYNAASLEREKAVRDAMRKLEYNALAKCKHGHPRDEIQWTAFQKTYNPIVYKANNGLGKLHPRLLCRKCTEANISVLEAQVANLQRKIMIMKL